MKDIIEVVSLMASILGCVRESVERLERGAGSYRDDVDAILADITDVIVAIRYLERKVRRDMAAAEKGGNVCPQ